MGMSLEYVLGAIILIGGAVGIIWKPMRSVLTLKTQVDDTVRIVGDLTSRISELSLQVIELKKVIEELQKLPARVDMQESSSRLMLEYMYVKENLPEESPQRIAVRKEVEAMVFNKPLQVVRYK